MSYRPYDNKYAIRQIEEGHKSLLQRESFSSLGNDSATGTQLTPISLDGKSHPRIITLGASHIYELLPSHNENHQVAIIRLFCPSSGPSPLSMAPSPVSSPSFCAFKKAK